jgi:hypothetical protein
VQDAASLAKQALSELAPEWQQAGHAIAQTDCAGSVDDINVQAKPPAIYRFRSSAEGAAPAGSGRSTLGESIISVQLSSFKGRKTKSIDDGKEATLNLQEHSGQHFPL